MNKVSRVTIFIFILGLILFLGLIFARWVVPNLVQPVAETVWLFLRVFILNVDQVYFWSLLPIAAVILAASRLVRKKSPVQFEQELIRNETRENLKNWQEAIAIAKHAGSGRDITRDKLLRLLISYYAAMQPDAGQADIRQQLQQHQLPVPESAHRFLFHSETHMSGDSFWKALYSPFQRWYRRLTGEEEALIDRMVDELIDLMKT